MMLLKRLSIYQHMMIASSGIIIVFIIVTALMLNKSFSHSVYTALEQRLTG